MNNKEFIHYLSELEINVTEKQLNQLEAYYNLLIEWNERMNLTGITDKKEVYLKHFYDSASLNKAINLKNITTFCDIGTGAGFPGLVIKILFPNLKVTLVDSLKKRLTFLEEVIKKLELKDIEIVHDRAELFSIKNFEKYDLVTARAVASLSILLEISAQCVKKEGYFIAMKANAEEEIKNSQNSFKKLSFICEKIEIFTLPKENSNRTLIKLKKIKSTNKRFPRKYTEIKKKPM